jgi:hypothetical protein
VLKSLKRRRSLRQQLGLHLRGDFTFPGSPAFGFLLFGSRAPLRFDGAGDIVPPRQHELIAIHILEDSEGPAPRLAARRRTEVNAAVVVTNEDGDVVQTDVWVQPVHRRDYKASAAGRARYASSADGPYMPGMGMLLSRR